MVTQDRSRSRNVAFSHRLSDRSGADTSTGIPSPLRVGILPYENSGVDVSPSSGEQDSAPTLAAMRQTILRNVGITAPTSRNAGLLLWYGGTATKDREQTRSRLDTY